MLFLYRSAPKVEKRIHSKFFRKFWEEPGYKRTDLHYCSNDDDGVLREIVMRANTHGTVSVILAEISTRVFFVAQMAHVRHLGVEKHLI